MRIDWRPVPGFNNYYEVSNLGNIRSNSEKCKGRLLKCPINNCGYPYTPLRINGKTFMRTVHRIVMAAFVGPCPGNHEVDHINGIKTDNRLSNLRYVTRAVNTQSAYDMGLIKPSKGQNHFRAKLTNKQVSEIKRLLGKARRNEISMSMVQIANKMGVHKNTIASINVGRSWKHICEPAC